MKYIKSLTALLLIACLSALVANYLHWNLMFWAPVLVCLLTFSNRRKGILVGFGGTALAFVVPFLYQDFLNDHILLPRVSALLGLNSFTVVFLTTVAGGFIGALGGWLGVEVRRSFRVGASEERVV